MITVLHDVVRCAILTREGEHSIAINDFNTLSFADLQIFVCGEHGEFVAGGTKPMDGGMITCVLAGASVATGHPDGNVHLSQEP